PKGSVVKGKVTEIESNRAVILLEENVEGSLRTQEMSEENVEEAQHFLKMDDEIEAKIINIDRRKRAISLSIKALVAEKEATAVQDYADSQQASGATIGDIFKEQIETQEKDPVEE
ncbi:MAG: S1 RNA-binding domain-containing protein, partial [Proteobacteria bacterium]|nr:S1 RNA-binding domain-containing protein [Pseudomonadota bacterium]